MTSILTIARHTEESSGVLSSFPTFVVNFAATKQEAQVCGQPL